MTIIEGEIQDIAFGGHGVFRHQGKVVFVPFAAPQDHVEVKLTQEKRSHSFGEISSLKIKSPHRIPAKCSFFGSCGGCQLQHIPYSLQLEMKKKFIEDALKRIRSIEFPVPSVIASNQQWGYRSHIRLNLKSCNLGFQAGYIGYHHEAFFSIDQCLIFNEFEHPFFNQLEQFLKSLSHKGIQQGSLRVFKRPNNRFLLAFSFFPTPPCNRESSISQALSNWSTWETILVQAPKMREEYGKKDYGFEVDGLKLTFTPYGFLQNHPEQSVNLYHYLMNQINGKKQRILDLYCGIGISSLLFARQGHHVTGVEVNKESIEIGRKNANLNQLNVTFISGKVETEALSLLQSFKPDYILVNPPRTGLSETLIKELLISKSSYLLYVSCMPSTLARDLKYFCTNGYQIESIQAFDMFPQTTHVETVVKLTSV